MEMYEIMDETFNLKNAIIDKSVRPEAVLDATVWLHKTNLDIRIGESFEEHLEPTEVILFFWDYQGARPLLVRETSIQDGSIILNIDQSLLHQMQLLKLNSVRVGVAFSMENQYFCGYIRNLSAKSGELTKNDRNIGKLMSLNQEAFIAYWTEGGILSVKFRDEKKFDDEFYRAILCGYRWENQVLTAYLETPFIIGEAKIRMYSMTTKAECGAAAISLEKAGSTGLKAVWKMKIDLTNMSLDDSDGYCLICELGGHSFRVFLDGEVDEDDLCEITLQSGEKLKSCVIKESNGQFILKTGGIYPVMLSIVTAVYNTAPFLAEMINSVLSQDVSKLEDYCRNYGKDYRKDYYRDIFEFILVDDGSTDGSADILDDYAQISDKIKVIHKENGGVSSARNAGIEIADGKYINFADSDDKLSKNFIAECLSFFEKHENEISIVTTPLKYFDGKSGDHWTNYKFTKENRVVDLSLEPDAVVYVVNASIVKKQDIGSRCFDESLRKGEDNLFINSIIISSGKGIGAVGKAIYFYRQRTEGELSAMAKSAYFAENYTDGLERVYDRLMSLAKEKYSYIPKYVQHSIMGQLQWRFASIDRGKVAKEVLGKDGYKLYKEKLCSFLKFIDDDIIFAQKKLWSEHYYYLLKKKYEKDPDFIFKNNDVKFVSENNVISTSIGNCYVRIDFLKISDNKLHIEGIGMNYSPNIKMLIYVNESIVEYNTINRDMNKYSLDDVVFYATPFSVNIELEEESGLYEIRFACMFEGLEIPKKQIRFSKTAPLSEKYKKSYYMSNGWVVRKEKTSIVVHNVMNSTLDVINYEEQFYNEVIHSEGAKQINDVLEIRKIALSWKTTMNKKIWLMCDRSYAARDNAEAMFRYINSIPDSGIEPYFVISKDSADFDRMKKIGNVIVWGSKRHFVLRLMSDYIVSSAADDIVLNPWYDSKEKTEVVKDILVNTNVIYLKHGIVMNDMSNWLNRYNKNLSAIVCAAVREKTSFIEYDYSYDEKDIWLTGLPRHDRLYNNEKNYITIMPTWRKWLTDKSVSGNKVGQNFTESEYFKFYNELINNERLLQAGQLNGYTICFMPHPNIQSEIELFHKDDRVIFFAAEKQYNEIFAESNLVMTDYSSACMDFALMEKPIIYCQFDEQQFFENHTVKHGYFDYVEDGFGEVTYDMESLIDLLILYMENGCKLHEPYQTRIRNFFAFHDKNNCKRVYQKIKSFEE